MDRKRLVLWIAVILTLAFIFGQSLLNQETSVKESNVVKEKIVRPVHEAVTGKRITDSTIRDIAHIVEYVVLGLELVFLFKDGKRLLCSVSYCGMVALLDESIQFMSDRAPQVIDIWNDILGGFIGAIIGIFLIIAIKKTKNGV